MIFHPQLGYPYEQRRFVRFDERTDGRVYIHIDDRGRPGEGSLWPGNADGNERGEEAVCGWIDRQIAKGVTGKGLKFASPQELSELAKKGQVAA